MTHLVASATVYVLLREDGSPWQAAAGTIIFLIPNWGAHNLLTGFQIGFILATACGCLTLAVGPRRPALAALLLTVSLATHGVGLFYLLATGVRLVGRRSVASLAIPALVYGAWFGPLALRPWIGTDRATYCPSQRMWYVASPVRSARATPSSGPSSSP
jgi:hypothetical protein